jgi:hypothetical protein
MLKKLAVIRGVGIRECPFGLPVTLACKTVGNAIDRMQPLEEIAPNKRDICKKANKRIFRHYADGKQCPYADSVIDHKNVTNCDYGDSAAGSHEVAFPASPVYPRIFNGLWPTGLFAYPINFYSDNYESRQIFSGIYSIYSHTGEINIKNGIIEPDPILIELTKI